MTDLHSDDIIAAASCGILAYDEQGQCVLANPAAAEIVGTTVENLLKQNFRQLSSWRDSGLLAMAEAVLASGERQTGDFHSTTTRGKELWAACKFSVFGKASKRYLLLVVTDITERKRVEAKLSEYEMAMEGLQEMLVVVDRNYRYLLANQAFLKYRGLRRDEIEGRLISELLNPGVFEREVKHHLDECLQGRVIHYEMRYSYPHLGERDLLITYFPIDGPNGVDRVACVLQDITERKQAEAALRESEENFRSMFEVASIGMGQSDPLTGQWVRVNRKLCEITGYPEAEMLRLKVPEVTHPEDRARDWELFQQVVRGERPSYQVEKRYLRKDGATAWVNVNMTVIRDAAGQPLRTMATIEDISGRKQLEAQFRQAQKMEAIGQLAGGVAHDFNNILTSIFMQVELAGMDAGLPAEVQEGLHQIHTDAERAAKLTHQLLLFSRRQVMQSRDLDLNEVVSHLTKMLQRIIGEDIRLQLNLHPTPTMTHADSGMLEQVLMNLAVNARDAMREGGSLNIRTEEQVVDEALARSHPDASPGSYVCLSVSDTGSGIPADVLPRIFEPFFTTKEPGKGTGLGLATVFGIVKQHRGWLTVDSPPGRGTTFRVFLPASVEVSGPAQADARSKSRGGTETILLAEDEAGVRKTTRALLARNGYKVLEAANGVEALQVWAEHQAAVALLLTDLVMPAGVSGQQLARRLQAETPGLKVIYVSGYSAEIAGREIELQDGENFLQKPVRPEELLKTIRDSLNG